MSLREPYRLAANIYYALRLADVDEDDSHITVSLNYHDWNCLRAQLQPREMMSGERDIILINGVIFRFKEEVDA